MIPASFIFGTFLSTMNILTLQNRLQLIMNALEFYFYKTKVEVKWSILKHLNLIQLTLH